MLPGVGGAELIAILVVALVVVGPKDLPRMMRLVAQAIGKAQSLANEFRSSFETLARQSELDELRQEIRSFRETPLQDAPRSGRPDETSAPSATPDDDDDGAGGTPAAGVQDAAEGISEAHEEESKASPADDLESVPEADLPEAAEAHPCPPVVGPKPFNVDDGMWH